MIHPISESLKGPQRAGMRASIVGGVAFTIVGVGLGYFLLAKPFIQTLRAADWISTPCQIISSQIARHESSSRKRSVTYSPEIRYRYTFGDQTYTSDRYNFAPTGSISYNRYSKVVESYSPGTELTCFVNAIQPDQAVLNRGFVSVVEWPFVLIVVAFTAVGLKLLVGSVRSLPTRKVSVTPAWLPPPIRNITSKAASFSDEWIKLRPETSRAGRVLGFGCVILFMSAGVYTLFLHDRGFEGLSEGPMGLTGFAIFGGVGLLSLLLWILELAAFFFEAPAVFVDKPTLVPGEKIRIRWTFPGGWSPYSEMNLRLICSEALRKKQGKRYCDMEHILFQSKTVAVAKEEGRQEGQMEIRIPDGAMHSFEFGDRRIKWVFRMQCKRRLGAGKGGSGKPSLEFGGESSGSDHPILVLPPDCSKEEGMGA